MTKGTLGYRDGRPAGCFMDPSCSISLCARPWLAEGRPQGERLSVNSGTFTQRNGINYNKKVLTVAVGTDVVIYVSPYKRGRMWDVGKTNDASCDATTCHY